jgi:hypothetical protein
MLENIGFLFNSRRLTGPRCKRIANEALRF